MRLTLLFLCLIVASVPAFAAVPRVSAPASAATPESGPLMSSEPPLLRLPAGRVIDRQAIMQELGRRRMKLPPFLFNKDGSVNPIRMEGFEPDTRPALWRLLTAWKKR